MRRVVGWLCHPWVSIVLWHGQRGQAGLIQRLPPAGASSILFCIQRPLEFQSSGFSVPPRTAAFAIQLASCLLPDSITPVAEIAKLQLGKENKI